MLLPYLMGELGVGLGTCLLCAVVLSVPDSGPQMSLGLHHSPFFLWAASWSPMTTAAEALEGTLLPALLMALTRNL